MTTKLTNQQIIETIAQIKGWNVSDITNLDLVNGTFQKGKSEYSFDLTTKGTMVKANSIKFLCTIESRQNLSY